MVDLSGRLHRQSIRQIRQTIKELYEQAAALRGAVRDLQRQAEALRAELREAEALRAELREIRQPESEG